MVLRGLIDLLVWFIKYYVPPMVANASPLLVHGRFRIDFSRNFIDNKPLFGSNKTWEGFLIGLYMGFTASLVLSIAFEKPYIMFLGFGSSLSALIGDLFGAFIKRRLGIKPGDPLPVVDQLDFALFSTLFYILVGEADFVSQPYYIVFSLALIIVLHVLTNNIAYLLGVKNKRW